MDQILSFKLAVLNEMRLLSEIQTSPQMMEMVNNPKIQKFIEFSKKKLSNKLTANEDKEIVSLLKDPKVQAYLEASKKVGERIGWIKGGTIGSIVGFLGSLTSFAALDVTGIGLAALGILGAIVGGLTTGYPVSKIQGILRKWKTEEEITKGGMNSGTFVKL